MLALPQVIHAAIAGRPRRRTAVGPIGVDIGIDVIHACQLRPSEDGRFLVTARAAIRFDETRAALLDKPSRLRKLLRDGLRRKGFVGRRLVAAMPADRVKFTPITYRAEQHKAPATILKMLSGRIEGDIADYVVDYLPVRNSSENEESLALAAVARRRDVLGLLEALNACGYEVDALDIGPAAVRRLLSVLYAGSEDEGETILVVNAGVERSYLSVISGRRLLFDQPVEFGEKRLLESVARVLDLAEGASRDLLLRHGIGVGIGAADDEVAATLREILKRDFVSLVDEINRVLIFTAAETRGRPIGRICLLGSIARWPGAGALLRELIDLPDSDTERDIADFFLEPGVAGPGAPTLFPEMAMACGLALRGLIDHV